MAYRCIRVLTPVMKRTIVIERGSPRNPIETDNSPEGIHSNRFNSYTRSSLSRDRSPEKTRTAVTNEAPTIVVATHPDEGSPNRLPERLKKRNPTRGKRGIRQSKSCTLTP